MFESAIAFVYDNASWIATCLVLVAATMLLTQRFVERSMRKTLDEETGFDDGTTFRNE